MEYPKKTVAKLVLDPHFSSADFRARLPYPATLFRKKIPFEPHDFQRQMGSGQNPASR